LDILYPPAGAPAGAPHFKKHTGRNIVHFSGQCFTKSTFFNQMFHAILNFNNVSKPLEYQGFLALALAKKRREVSSP